MQSIEPKDATHIRMLKNFGPLKEGPTWDTDGGALFRKGSIHEVLAFTPHGGHSDDSHQFTIADPRDELAPVFHILGSFAEPCPDPAAPVLTEKLIRRRVLDGDSAHRKQYPLATGLLDYFPDALAEVAKVSKMGNDKHNPGQPIHHARGKSMDHADCIMRHLAGRGGFDGDTRESASLAWRALALLQEELEAEMGLPLPRGAWPPEADDAAAKAAVEGTPVPEDNCSCGGGDASGHNLGCPEVSEPIPAFLPRRDASFGRFADETHHSGEFPDNPGESFGSHLDGDTLRHLKPHSVEDTFMAPVPHELDPRP